jgi:hypothetical protein
VGVDVDKIYRENDTQLRTASRFAWTIGGAGRTVLAAAYGSAVDQPGTTAVRHAGNRRLRHRSSRPDRFR